MLSYKNGGVTWKPETNPDPVIVEENRARIILGLRLRRLQYIDDFIQNKNHRYYVDIPSNWESLKERAEKTKP
jgi:hypothetical protein